MNSFENGLDGRYDIANKQAIRIYVNSDKKKEDSNEDFAIKLGVTFRGPIFGLLIGYFISNSILIFEYILIYY